jgi:hypothetical protein
LKGLEESFGIKIESIDDLGKLSPPRLPDTVPAAAHELEAAGHKIPELAEETQIYQDPAWTLDDEVTKLLEEEEALMLLNRSHSDLLDDPLFQACFMFVFLLSNQLVLACNIKLELKN